MGMFDRLYDHEGHEWQTKALFRTLRTYRIGDPMPGLGTSYQIPCLTSRDGVFKEGWATVVFGRLEEVGGQRDTDGVFPEYGDSDLAVFDTFGTMEDLIREYGDLRATNMLDDVSENRLQTIMGLLRAEVG